MNHGDGEGLAEAIMRSMDDSDTRAAMGDTARRRCADLYAMQAVLQQARKERRNAAAFGGRLE